MVAGLLVLAVGGIPATAHGRTSTAPRANAQPRATAAPRATVTPQASAAPRATARQRAHALHHAHARKHRTHAGTPTPPPPTISLHASSLMTFGVGRVVLSGKTTNEPADTAVQLFKLAYPFHNSTLVRTAYTNATGAFAFVPVFPDRDTRYEAVIANTTTRATVEIEVIGKTWTHVAALSLGRAQVTVLVYHPADLRWGDARVQWSFANGYYGSFYSAPSSRTVRKGLYADELTTTIALPAGHFRWRACFSAPDDQALGNPRRPSDCSGRGYHGSGSLPFGYPSAAAIAGAEAYLNSRGGHTALAVVTTEGREYGIRIHDQFITGSAVKAMLLVAYLRHLDAIGQHYVDSYSNSFLYPMINVSDNNAATQCWSIVGNPGLRALARAAGMTDFSVPDSAPWGGEWGTALLSAADQARFFFEMDSLIPREFVGYARYLLSTIAGYESWGIPAIARPLGYTVFFKAGWRPSPDTFLVHQIARLEGHGRTFSMAVMTDGDPDMGYGIQTIQGVASTLLR